MTKNQDIDFRESPVVWFTTMELEKNRGNFVRAAEAKQELERLGVFVRFKGKLKRQYKRVEMVLSKQKPTVLAREMSR